VQAIRDRAPKSIAAQLKVAMLARAISVHAVRVIVSDIKLFRIAIDSVREVAGDAVQVEKSLQSLFESNLDALLGVKFLASEYSTGPIHGGRIDTLGIDEDGSPVIVEYKRAINENVINQGLYYLDWLFDHRGDFKLLVLETLGQEAADDIDWSSPRLICIAGNFTRYDEHAVKQIQKNIELLRYRRFGGDLLLLELIHVPKQTRTASIAIESESTVQPAEVSNGDPYRSQRINYRIAQADARLRDIFEAVRQSLLALGDDVREKELKNYIAFKRIKNFACLEIYPQSEVVIVYLKVDPKTVTIEEGFTRDVSKIGHFGTGNLEVQLRAAEDLAKAQPLFLRSYEGS
jgi:predicted transport protein